MLHYLYNTLKYALKYLITLYLFATSDVRQIFICHFFVGCRAFLACHQFVVSDPKIPTNIANLSANLANRKILVRPFEVPSIDISI